MSAFQLIFAHLYIVTYFTILFQGNMSRHKSKETVSKYDSYGADGGGGCDESTTYALAS